MPEPSGRRILFWLFVALAVATAFALLLFAQLVEPRFRGRVYGALVLDLSLPVVGWFLMKRFNRPIHA